jgi:hypothetical protein
VGLAVYTDRNHRNKPPLSSQALILNFFAKLNPPVEAVLIRVLIPKNFMILIGQDKKNFPHTHENDATRPLKVSRSALP